MNTQSTQKTEKKNGKGKNSSKREASSSSRHTNGPVYVPIFIPASGGMIPSLPTGQIPLIFMEGAQSPAIPTGVQLAPAIHVAPSKNQLAKFEKTEKKPPVKNEEMEAHKKSVQDAKEANVKLGIPGKVTCGFIPHKEVKGSKKWPKKAGYKNINVTGGFMKTVVPHNLGPVAYPVHDPTGKILSSAKNFFNFWQAAKVFDYELQVPIGVPQFGEGGFQMRSEYISPSYWTERERLHNLDTPTRKLKSDFKKGDPKPRVVCYIFDNALKSEAEARIYYCHIYSALVTATGGYKDLKVKLTEGYNVQIVGHKGRDLDELDNIIDFNILYQKWSGYLMDIEKPFEHEMILTCMCMMLDPRYFPWNNVSPQPAVKLVAN